MKVYHGTNLVAKKAILAEGKIHSSQSSLETSIDVLLEWATKAHSVEDLPTMGRVSQPAALGDGVYAFKDIKDARTVSSDHCVITITLNDNAKITNLDSCDEMRKLAWELFSTDYEPIFRQRAYSTNMQQKLRKLFLLFAEFILDVLDDNSTIERYPYVFAYSLWVLEKMFNIKLSIVSRTFLGQPTYVCIRDSNTIKEVTA
ncbi:hypothetical protein L3C06_08995 [Lacticaseibacillus paracasei subsp. paracasei]|jgi:hypothetical protein|uniref:hypothetical protein n=1 Tax=Lacticaseibacillus paracasei TaxID=1597 RepID=UPI000EB78325|nr:hypothetical protein [Lacticaseibacillus paracasei]AYG21686.1 hypothetical protein CFM84_00245 [Lacticaseibacillus paracasei]UJS06751.1 hypothetical protein L3C06_08995 [Lacticaseibacillus paracasei subsp. paracasei]